METLILISVLVILGVASITRAIVVIFKRLNTKANINEIDRVYQSLDAISINIHQRLEDITQSFGNDINEVYRKINSNKDALDKEVDKLNQKNKEEFSQLLNTIETRYNELQDLITIKKRKIKNVRDLLGSDQVEVSEVDTSYKFNEVYDKFNNRVK